MSHYDFEEPDDSIFERVIDILVFGSVGLFALAVSAWLLAEAYATAVSAVCR